MLPLLQGGYGGRTVGDNVVKDDVLGRFRALLLLLLADESVAAVVFAVGLIGGDHGRPPPLLSPVLSSACSSVAGCSSSFPAVMLV